MAKWTTEQREAQGRRLRAFHAKKKRAVVLLPRRRSSELTLRDLPRLVEAHDLCERIGWDILRQIAGRIAR